MGKLPAGWCDYTPIGKRMEGTLFICFKVPLQRDQEEFAEENRLSPASLMERIPQLGMVIDLTDTDRYYNPQEFIRQGVLHKKLRIQGHVLPQRSSHNTFRNIVNNYLAENSDSEKLIGVHCTHGLNRTGLMVCSYLVKEGKMSAEEAIQAFELSRGHEMQRENYLQAIKRTIKLDESERHLYSGSGNQRQMQGKLRNTPDHLIRQAAEKFGSPPNFKRTVWRSNHEPAPRGTTNPQSSRQNSTNESGRYVRPPHRPETISSSANWRSDGEAKRFLAQRQRNAAPTTNRNEGRNNADGRPVPGSMTNNFLPSFMQRNNKSGDRT